MIWFIQSLVLYSAFLLFVSMGYAISCFASLSLKGIATDLKPKMMQMIARMHQVRISVKIVVKFS